MVRARVRITRVDAAHNTVSFIGPAQVERTVEVHGPQLQRSLRALNAGDEVDLT
jgi:hypothetical protein